jgi:hypothetical protein
MSQRVASADGMIAPATMDSGADDAIITGLEKDRPHE